MMFLRRMRRRLRSIFSKTAIDRDMDEEMRLHLDLESEDLVRAGLSAEEAARRARAAFGGVEAHKEAARDGRGVSVLEDLMRDARYAASALRRSPGFTITTVVTLAVGISAITLVFSAIDSLFLRRLAVRDPNQLAVVQELWKNGATGPSDMGQMTYPYEHFLDFQAATKGVFTDVAASVFDIIAVRRGPYAIDMTAVVASSNYFAVLGVRPALGRFFTVTNERSENTPAEVVIGHDMWERDFNSDSSVIGRTLFVDSRPLSIIGVAPSNFGGTISGIVAELWIPSGFLRDQLAAGVANPSSTSRNLDVTMFARRRADVTAGQAKAMLAVIAPQLPAEHQASRKQWITGVQLDPLSGLPAMARGPFTVFMSMLMITAFVVLLIAVSNVAGMLLARGAYRQKEIAVRLTLGASRGRLIRQLLTESLLLCAIGASGGLLLVRWLLSFVPTLQPPVPMRVAFDVHVDPIVLGVTLAVAVLSGILAGLTPALQSTRTDVTAGLRGFAQGQSARVSRMREVFIVGQLSLSLVLLITAGLFSRALGRALHTDPGFDPRGVVTAGIDLSEHGYDRERGQALYAELLTRLRARPEVAEASMGRWTPLGNNYNGEMVYLPGEQAPTGRKAPLGFGVVDAGYLEMMQVPVIAGRTFTTADLAGTPQVIIINETAARRFWPGESPLGRTITLHGAPREVVGVTRDGKYNSLDESPQNYAFVPFAQRYLPYTNLFVRARGDSSTLAGVLRQELAAVDPNVALQAPMALSRQISIYVLPQRIAASIVGVFGAVGLLLAVVGVYGVVAYHVGQRRREFGIRLALGASRTTLIRLVLGRGFKLIGIAVVAGAMLSLAVTILARRFLFGLGAADPLTFGAMSLLLAVVAACASYLPARRASRADPMAALRVE
jgi:putative ABC transport system permease protein